MNQLTDIDKRVQRDADSFMSSVKTAEDDNAVVLLVMMYPRIASNEAAYSAYKEAIARMRREGKENLKGLSGDVRYAQITAMAESMQRVREEDSAEREKLFAELDKIRQDAAAQERDRQEYLYRNQSLANQQQIMSQQRELEKRQQELEAKIAREIQDAEWRLRNLR